MPVLSIFAIKMTDFPNASGFPVKPRDFCLFSLCEWSNAHIRGEKKTLKLLHYVTWLKRPLKPLQLLVTETVWCSPGLLLCNPEAHQSKALLERSISFCLLIKMPLLMSRQDESLGKGDGEEPFTRGGSSGSESSTSADMRNRFSAQHPSSEGGKNG